VCAHIVSGKGDVGWLLSSLMEFILYFLSPPYLLHLERLIKAVVAALYVRRCNPYEGDEKLHQHK